MSRVLRFAWVLLLTLALPLQGLAAATMAACGPVHGERGSHAVLAHQASAHQASGQGFSSHEAHGHGHGIVAHDTHVVDATATDDRPADDAPSTPPIQTCSVCASCCTASVGLPAEAVVAEPAASAESFVDLVPGSPPVFLTDRLERPPRSFLA